MSLPPSIATTEVYPSPSPLPLAGYEVPGWAEAIAAVEQHRGSPGRITVPDALRHADDRRLFLAVQLADAHQETLRPPHDLADLARMVLEGQLAEMEPASETYILYEVGADAREDPLAHFDVESEKDVPLLGSMSEYEAELARLAALANGPGAAAADARTRRDRLASHYGNPARREALFQERAAIEQLAASFGGRRYDLADPVERARFQARLLSFLRPAARDVIMEVAQAYHQRFGRRLPLSSLVRTQRYQRRLARVNRNATSLDLPPHATGMAFDVLYKFMAPDEQNFVMEHLARLDEAGRLEALRERRNHIHVYVFGEGHPPPRTLVADFLDEVEEAHPGSAPAPRAPRSGTRAR